MITTDHLKRAIDVKFLLAYATKSLQFSPIALFPGVATRKRTQELNTPTQVKLFLLSIIQTSIIMLQKCRICSQPDFHWDSNCSIYCTTFMGKLQLVDIVQHKHAQICVTLGSLATSQIQHLNTQMGSKSRHLYNQ